MGIACMKHDLVDVVICSVCHHEQIEKIEKERDAYKKVAEEWLKKCEDLKNKLEIINYTIGG